MADRVLRFYFDYISHNAYLAWAQIHGLAKKHGCTVEPVPVLFAKLLETYGQVGPAEVPPKSAWMLRNVLRKAADLGIPINPPATHPFNPLLALRASSLDMDGSIRRALIDRLFRAVWVDGIQISDPAAIRIICDAGGLQDRDVLNEVSAPSIKEKLRIQTEDAVRAGVFGVPTMIVDGELFWGYDDFPQLETFLAGNDPLPPDYRSRWESVRPSALRPRQGTRSA